MASVLILGGGFGGVAAAVSLSKQLAQDNEITLVDRRDSFFFGFRKTWAFLGAAPMSEGMRPLKALEGGRVAIVIPNTPYPCPPAPFETALLLSEYFSSKAIEAEIHVYSPKPMSLPIVGESGCSVLEGKLSQEGITFHPSHTVESIEAGKVRFDTATATYDLLIGIPGHVCPKIVVDSGLTDGGAWAKADSRTLETDFPRVYAIGDMVSIPLVDGKALPKAGVFAEAHGKIAAERIAASLRGESPSATYDGAGYCFLEVGKGKAMLVKGNFLTEPHADVQLAEPAAEHYRAKVDFEHSRLSEWFPA